VTVRFRNGILAALLGAACGLAVFTFLYARGPSYLFDDPAVCMNCHVMRAEFDSWNRSSHKAAATCNACHTPHNLAGKYAVKALNGWNHGLAFTTGRYPDPIMIRGLNERIAADNCFRCHENMTSRMTMLYPRRDIDCSACHGNVGHLARR
jgi:cytochrome c nitrite reductase small subunit